MLNPPKMSYHDLMTSVAAGGTVMVMAIIASGALGDIVGRRKIVCTAQILTGVSILPLFLLLLYTNVPGRIWPLTVFHMIIFGLLSGAQQGSFPALLSDVFPPPIRCTGVSVVWALSRIPSSAILITIMPGMLNMERWSQMLESKDVFWRSSLCNLGIAIMIVSLISAISTILVPVSSYTIAS